MDEKERWLNWINNLKKIDNIGPPKLLPSGEEQSDSEEDEDWEVNPDDVIYVTNIVRQNGLPINEEFIEMMATVLGEMRKIVGQKINSLLWNYIMIVIHDRWSHKPETQRFAIMQTALIMGIALERTIDWEFYEPE